MRHFITCLLIMLALNGCTTQSNKNQTFGSTTAPMAEFYMAKNKMQCVPYARKISGIQIYGNAHTWWRQAPVNSRYAGPIAGSVMVLSKGRRLRYGHIAVVKRVLNDREIEVTHRNWGNNRKRRLRVFTRHRVKDVSTNNDWSKAVFWNPETKAFGSPYPVSGFILDR